jgi:hypothetical protein
MIAAALSGIALLALIFVPVVLGNWGRFKAAWRDVTRGIQ